MSDVIINPRPPTVDEFVAFRRSAGWHVPEPDAVAQALKATSFSVCAEKDGAAVGMARVVGDGALCFYVQDVIVLPEYQRKGHGTKLMDAVMDYINRNAWPTAYIALFSARGLEPFYSRYGFIERPHKHLGPGMAFFRK